jgi:DNA polymerase-3 subunit delta'
VPAPILQTLLAQDTAKATLERALARDRVHHAYLFDGPEGVGKERAALGLAQALVCERRAPGGDSACGECSACVRVPIRAGEKRPAHPDVIMLERALYSAEQIGRKTPENQDLSADQVRTLVVARAAYAPHEGKARVYIMRRADEMNVFASNTLLKSLEEPGDRTHFILMTSMADSLLPTIRSRTQRVRFARLPDALVETLLIEAGTKPDDARAVSKLAHGSMAEAASLADPETTEARRAFVDKALASLRGHGLGALLDTAEVAKKQKDVLPLHLVALAQRLAEESCDEALHDGPAVSAANRYRLALTALRQLDGNASAALVVESMLIRMRSE